MLAKAAEYMEIIQRIVWYNGMKDRWDRFHPAPYVRC